MGGFHARRASLACFAARARESQSRRARSRTALPFARCLSHAHPTLYLRLPPTAARSEDAARQLEGVVFIRRLLSKESSPPVEAVLRANVLPRLVALLASATDAKLQFEAAWAITNIASTEYTRHVVDAGAVAPLVAGMMSADATLRDQCIWCIGNIAGDCAGYRDGVLATPGALQALLLNIQNPAEATLLRNATWTLSNFCRGKPTPSPAVIATILPALAFLLNSDDREVLQDAAWGVSYLTDGDEAAVQAVLDAGIAPRCIALMAHTELTVVTPALRIVGNFISGSDVQTSAAIAAGALPALVPLLAHSKRNIKREACWAVSNVAAGTREQLNALFSTPGVMNGVVELLGAGREADWNVRREAAWVVSNAATVGAPEHLAALMEMGVCEPLVDILGATRDPRMLGVVLDAVDGMLASAVRHAGAGADARAVADTFEEHGLLNALEMAQETATDDVYAKAVRIIETYYGTVAETDPADDAAFAFGAAGGPFNTLAAVASRANAAPPASGQQLACFGAPASAPFSFTTMNFS